jgi:hypothetical protein
MWSIVASAVLLGVGGLRLPYKASTGLIDKDGESERVGFSIALGAAGFISSSQASSSVFAGRFPLAAECTMFSSAVRLRWLDL